MNPPHALPNDAEAQVQKTISEKMFLWSFRLFFVFVTPEGFTTVVANEGLEKARARSPGTDGLVCL